MERLELNKISKKLLNRYLNFSSVSFRNIECFIYDKIRIKLIDPVNTFNQTTAFHESKIDMGSYTFHYGHSFFRVSRILD